MGRWTSVLTNQGAALLARSPGNTLRFTSASCGSGSVEESQLVNATSVSAVKLNLSISAVESAGSITKVRLQLSNINLAAGFQLRQIGLFAKIDGDAGEVLYMIMQNNAAFAIPSKTEEANYTHEFLANLIVGGAANITANVDSAAFSTVGHKHKASDIETGTLPLSRGGTGAGSAAAALSNLQGVPKNSDSVIICNGASGNEGAIAVGISALAGENGMSIGHHTVSGDAAIAIGAHAQSGLIGTAIGGNSVAVSQALALGTGAKAESTSSGAIGDMSRVDASSPNTMQLGANTTLSALKCRVNLSVTSDERDKSEIAPIENALEFIKKIEAIQYVDNDRKKYLPEKLTEKDEALISKYGLCGCYDTEEYAAGTKKGSRKRVGVSAQNVGAALCEVYGSSDYANLVNDNLHDVENIPEGVESQLTVAYANFVPFLIKAISELSSEIDALQERLSKIQSQE